MPDQKAAGRCKATCSHACMLTHRLYAVQGRLGPHTLHRSILGLFVWHLRCVVVRTSWTPCVGWTAMHACAPLAHLVHVQQRSWTSRLEESIDIRLVLAAWRACMVVSMLHVVRMSLRKTHACSKSRLSVSQDRNSRQSFLHCGLAQSIRGGELQGHWGARVRMPAVVQSRPCEQHSLKPSLTLDAKKRCLPSTIVTRA